MSSICWRRIRSRNVACASIERLEVALATEIERMDAGKARRSRALDHVVADREHARRGDDAEQAGLLQVDAALVRCECCRTCPSRRLDRARGIGEQLGEAGSPRAASNASRHRSRRARVAVDTAQIEEDVDRQEILRVRAADPLRDALRARSRASRARAGSSPSRRPAIGHADLVQDVGDVRRQAPRTSDPPGRPARPRRTPARCPGPWPAGSRRGRPSPAPQARKGRAARPARRRPCGAPQ